MAWTIRDSLLVIFQGFANAVFNHPAFQVDRLPGRCRKLCANHILDHPADFLKDLPGPFTRCPGRLQFVEKIDPGASECRREDGSVPPNGQEK